MWNKIGGAAAHALEAAKRGAGAALEVAGTAASAVGEKARDVKDAVVEKAGDLMDSDGAQAKAILKAIVEAQDVFNAAVKSGDATAIETATAARDAAWKAARDYVD